jgi:hypothetical protein
MVFAKYTLARHSQYPHNPFHVGYLFRGYAGSQLLRPARLLASPDGSDWHTRPATGGLPSRPEELPSGPEEFRLEPLTDSVREPLDSYGSCHRVKAAAFH